MGAKDNPSEGQEPYVTASLLQRLLSSFEDSARSRRLEIASAALLGLATTASAWSAYQSNLWSGVQRFRLAAASETARQSTDPEIFNAFIEASVRGDKKLADFPHPPFRPEMRKTLGAWLRTDPFSSPNAPIPAFEMTVYIQAERAAAGRADEEQARMMTDAQQASQALDKYVLLTVRFSAVLFLGGIVSTFESRRLRTSVFLLPVALFTLTAIDLAALPICRE